MNGWAIHNPGNLRFIAPPATPWDGQTGEHDGYGVYSSDQYGVRAAGKQATKIVAAGNTTLRTLITTWAPPEENDTAAYISDVSTRTNIDPDAALDWPSAEGDPVGGNEPDVMAAIFIHETGSMPLTADQLVNYLNS